MLPGTGESWCLPTRMLRMLVNQHTMRSVTCAVIRVMIVIRVCYTPITCLQTFFGQINNYRAPGHVCSAHIDTYTYTCVYIYAYAHWIFFWIFFVATRTLLRGRPKGFWGCFQLSWCLQHLTYEITINIRTQPCIHIHIQKQIYVHIPSQLHIHTFIYRYSYKRPNNYTYKYPYIYRHVYPSQYTSNSQWLFGYIHALRKVASV